LYHVILGSGFPLTGQDKDTGSPKDTLVFGTIPLVDGGSKKKECNKKMNGYAFYKIFEWKNVIFIHAI